MTVSPMAKQKKDTSILSILTSIVIFAGILYIACCGDRGGMIVESSDSVEVIPPSEKLGTLVFEIKAGVPLSEVLLFDIYAPYDRSVLKTNPAETYGEPDDSDSGFDKKESHSYSYLDYTCDLGAIRISNDSFFKPKGPADSIQTIEVFTDGIDVRQVIHEEYLDGFTPPNREWEMSLSPIDLAWSLVLKLEGYEVKCIIDMELVDYSN